MLKLLCLKGRPNLADDDEIEQLKETVIDSRDREILILGLDESSIISTSQIFFSPRHVVY